MKVRELIEELKKQDPESYVFTRYIDKIDVCHEVWSEKYTWIRDEDKKICFIGLNNKPEGKSNMHLN